MYLSHKNILFMMTGSIASFKACQVISQLVKMKNQVHVVATPSALKFVGLATLEGLTGKPVATDLWETGRTMDHIHLSRWCNLGVICPATAHSLAHFSLGLGETLLDNIVLAWPPDKPLHIFPAMNVEMLKQAPTVEHMDKLKDRGFHVYPTGEGSLACGEVGLGRLQEPEDILSTLKNSTKPLGRLLVTSGATREPVDGIRFLTNVSTGKTGCELVEQFSRKGFLVDQLYGEGSQTSSRAHELQSFSSCADLHVKIKTRLNHLAYDGVIHCAAVGDFHVSEINGSKSSSEAELVAQKKLSSAESLNFKLSPNPKLLPLLKSFSQSAKIKVVGFKLTVDATLDENWRAAQSLLGENVDAVISNDWSSVRESRAAKQNPKRFLHTKQNSVKELSTMEELVEHLSSLILPGEIHANEPENTARHSLNGLFENRGSV